MKWLLTFVAPAVLLAASDVSAQDRRSASQSTPATTLETYLNGQFIDVVTQCAGITRFQRYAQRIPAVPIALRSSLGTDLAGGYQSLDNRTLTDLYSAIWTAPAAGVSAEFGSYRRLTDGLALRFSNADDRVVYGEGASTRHTHNCSTVVSFALQAGARLGGDELAAALKSSHDDTTNLNLSLVTGTFQSPIWDVFSNAPGRQPPRANRFAANAALWQWYRAEPARADEANKYYLLDQFDGLALYRFAGLSWRTMVGGSTSAGGSLAVVSANASVRGQLDATGSTSTSNYHVLRFARSVPTFRLLPSVATIAAGLAETADFTPVGGWTTTPITSQAPVRLSHEIALPARLCDSPNWTSNNVVTELDVRSISSDDPGAVERCRFSAVFTPPTTSPAGGTVPIQYEATLPFPSATNPPGPSTGNRAIKFIVGRGESIADYRARISLLPIDGSLRRGPNGALVGEFRFRLSTLPGTTVESFAPAPTIYVSCEGDEPKLAVANVDLVQPSGSQAREAHVRIVEAQTDQWDRLAVAGGTCRVSGHIQAIVTGVSTPVTVDAGVRTAPVAGDPAAIAALAEDDREKSLFRLNAASPQ